jgi:hypothetical protein
MSRQRGADCAVADLGGTVARQVEECDYNDPLATAIVRASLDRMFAVDDGLKAAGRAGVRLRGTAWWRMWGRWVRWRAYRRAVAEALETAERELYRFERRVAELTLQPEEHPPA